MLAQTTLRAVLGQHELDEMLSERKKLSTDVQSILDVQTETWGIKVSNVEIRTVELTENMVRAIAKQAEAERDRRAKIIHADAEFQAAQTLVDAAQILASIPAAMQLRYLQTLTEIGAEQTPPSSRCRSTSETVSATPREDRQGIGRRCPASCYVGRERPIGRAVSDSATGDGSQYPSGAATPQRSPWL